MFLFASTATTATDQSLCGSGKSPDAIYVNASTRSGTKSDIKVGEFSCHRVPEPVVPTPHSEMFYLKRDLDEPA